MQKRKLLWIFTAVAIAVVFTSMNAMADKVTVGYTSLGKKGAGGPFEATVTENPNGYLPLGSFTTFCLERDDTINPNGTTEYSFVLNDRAIQGGKGVKGLDSRGYDTPGYTDGDGVQDNYDPVSSATALLYYEFRNNTLDDHGTLFTFSYTSLDDHVALQEAIWKIENEPDQNKGTAGLAQKLLDYGRTNATGSRYGVRAMNLGNNGKNQDLLAMSTVPLPPVVLLMGTGILGFFGVRRKMKS